MPIIKSAKKAARQAVKRKSKNEAIKKTIRNALKDFRLKPSAEKMAIVQSEYDKAVKKGLLKKNTASRRKAKLAKIAKESGVKLKAAVKTAAKVTKSAAKTTKAATKTAKATAAKTSEKSSTKKAPVKKTAAKREAAKKKA